MNKDKKEKKQELQKVRPEHFVETLDDEWSLAKHTVFEEMERFFESPFHLGWWPPFHLKSPITRKVVPPFAGKTPRIDIREEDEQFVLKAELPGVDKKDINVSIAKNNVTIEALTMQEEKEEEGPYFRQEIARGSFFRSLTLPADIREDKVQAKFSNGMLTLILPKLEKTTRTEIKVE